MSALSKFLRDAEGNRLHFWCPGCDEMHGIKHGDDGWSWNGDAVRPTFSPSILVTWDYGDPPVGHRCHSYVKDGQIQFLGDCTHQLAGTTVPLPEWAEE